ncbi:telomeric repeat-binding factor 2 isoform X1 [Solea senegalensis]|uniref:Telomeric repeat-binding factor 2 isoform X1 n=2 Tax=Solea senegalensis TaxID=28829 RepID=A0AAV6Q4L8_SOLSE|nr:telomeric repeat binding factor a [Solea senegalensis]KAG7482522.1 telomeric repeat-binding factor 2 isoform X1 [Solea senegalensis]
MAAMETTVHSLECHQTAVETIVNRWIVDYYAFLALESLQKERYTDFCSIKNVLDGVLDHAMSGTHTMAKIQVLRFLSCIYEGEQFDVSSVSDQSTTPLETALMLLERIRQDYSVPPQDFENACSSIREMIMVIFLQNNKFDKAKKMLTKHFPKPMVGKKAIFMGLINQRSKTHEVIEHINFPQFKKEMLSFCQRLCPFGFPFLYTAAEKLIDERLRRENDNAAGPDEQEEPGPSSSLQTDTALFVPCKHKIIQRTRLEAAFNVLSERSDMRTFAQLEEEVEREEQAREDISLRLSPSPIGDIGEDSEQNKLFQRGSGSPMEASPAEQPPQTDTAPHTQVCSLSKSPAVLRNRRHFTVAQLVVEPDSQVSSQSTTASLEQENEIREESPQSPTISNNQVPQSPLTDNEITKPSWKLQRRGKHRCSRAATSLESSNSEDDLPAANKQICVRKHHDQSYTSLRGNSSKSRGIVTSSDGEENLQDSSSCIKTPVQPDNPLSDNPDDVFIMDSSSEGTHSAIHDPIPQTSSTPHKDSPHSKWKQLFNNAKESKERWSDEESPVASRKKNGSHDSTLSNSSHRKMWSDHETKLLIEGVRKFGEGNWSRIKGYYTFNGRTNVNLKDRWRTLKKSKLV